MTKSKTKAAKGKTRTAKGKKRGGQPGNKNALRHGFYASRFSADENKRLDGQDPTDVRAEIAFLRVCADRLAEQLDMSAVYFVTKDGTPTDIRDDHYLKQLNTLAAITQSIGTLTRTDNLIRGKGGEIIDLIEQALEEVRLEMGL